MSDFQERLWSELVGEHAFALAYPTAARDRLSPLPIVEPRRLAGRPRVAVQPGRVLVGLAALASALAAVVIATTTGTAPSSAYAVSQDANGTVHVSISDLMGVAGANAKLEGLGVPVRVVPVVPGCTAAGEIVLPPPPVKGPTAAHADAGITVQPDQIPRGETLVLTARQEGAAMYLSYAFYRGAVPSCVAVG
jgi:hypothetical protein